MNVGALNSCVHFLLPNHFPDLGGTLGLFAGVSILGMFEFGFWMLKILLSAIRRIAF